jgi:hypothetical protein
MTNNDEKEVNLIVKVITKEDDTAASVYSIIYLMDIMIYPYDQNTEIKKITRLVQKAESRAENEVKCLVCSNDRKTTYVFLCYEKETHHLSIFPEEVHEGIIEMRVIGSGIKTGRVNNYLLFIDSEIINFSLFKDLSFNYLMKYFLTEIEENSVKRQKIEEANLQTVESKMEGDDEK